jgi:hypothetical protein
MTREEIRDLAKQFFDDHGFGTIHLLEAFTDFGVELQKRIMEHLSEIVLGTGQ